MNRVNVSSEFFVRPKASDTIVDSADEFINATMLREEVVDHAAMREAVDATLRAYRLASE